MVAVVSYNCSSKAQQIALHLDQALKALGTKAKVMTLDSGDCHYWDGSAALFISAAPLGYETKTPALAAPLAFCFPGPEQIRSLADEVSSILAKRGVLV